MWRNLDRQIPPHRELTVHNLSICSVITLVESSVITLADPHIAIYIVSEYHSGAAFAPFQLPELKLTVEYNRSLRSDEGIWNVDHTFRRTAERGRNPAPGLNKG